MAYFEVRRATTVGDVKVFVRIVANRIGIL